MIGATAQAIHPIDPYRPVTASISGSASDAAYYADAAELDVAAWHEPRVSSWWDSTASGVATMRAIMSLPVYLQEPAPHGDSAWDASGVLANVEAAKSSGAAAWCFHTRASFYLNGSTLFNQLSPPEVGVLDNLADAVDSVSWGI